MIEELTETGGSMSAQTRESLATEAFGATARYDAAISRWFAEREDDFPNQYVAAFEKVLDLSYGENPHQRAAYYEQVGMRTHLLARTVKVHGKELSFNNLLDLDSGRALAERVRGARGRDHQAQQPVRRARSASRSPRPTSARSPATRRAPTAASWC